MHLQLLASLFLGTEISIVVITSLTTYSVILNGCSLEIPRNIVRGGMPVKSCI